MLSQRERRQFELIVEGLIRDECLTNGRPPAPRSRRSRFVRWAERRFYRRLREDRYYQRLRGDR